MNALNLEVLRSPQEEAKRDGRWKRLQLPRKRSYAQKICDEWLETQAAALAPSSKLKHATSLRIFCDWLRKKKLPYDQVTWQTMAAWMKEMVEAKLHRTTILKRLAIVRRVYDFLQDDGRILKNPVNYHRLPRLPKQFTERKAISPDQFGKLIDACVTLKSLTRTKYAFPATRGNQHAFPDWVRWALVIGWYTGLRISDVACLQWKGERSEVDIQNAVIYVYPIKTLASRRRLEIPIHPILQDELFLPMFLDREAEIADCKKVSDWVLPMMHWTYLDRTQWRNTQNLFARVFKKAGLSDYSFHSLRHGFVTRHLNANVEPLVIAAITGQSLPVLQRYGKISMDTKRKAMHQADDHEFLEKRVTM